MTTTRDTVLITGCNGFIGSAVMDRLAGKYNIAGFDTQESESFPADGLFCNVDLTSEESVQAGLEQVLLHFGKEIRSVIHLAAYYSFSGEPSPLYEQVTVRGTERLLRGLHPFDVKQFIFSSTMLVHAPANPGVKIHEDLVLEPKWAYPQSKVETEQLLRERRGRIPIVLLRIAGVYDDTCHSIPLAHQIQRIHERHMTSNVFPGDLSHGQSFIHLEDLVDVLERLVERAGQLPEELPLLIGEEEALSYDELQKEFGRLIHGEEWTTTTIPKAVAKAGAWVQDRLPFFEDPFIKPFMISLADDHYELDLSRAKKHLDWAPRHSLRETLPKMVAALKADPVKWYEQHHLTVPSDLKEKVISG